ncbi:preprotein translocase subunit SecA [Schaalia sp. 19OD2882]|uniref:preprotein translocase subunit SecA n=1 Tax=Schaalia sp. 19OD2882 TaxID=2794089 RepID=UPI001C1EDA6E|nr:preprotein translocase subunit SecA [Schaalia sp. 19OD2882]QWW20629.1 preprotein translocase subunit SecA [Schaalia sp. 19OD2882]
MGIIDKILRAGEGRQLRKLDRTAKQVEALREDFEQLTDEELRAKTDEFKERLAQGETLDDLLVEAFATVREAAWRVLRQRPFHVQIMGGAALHGGNIAEMKTGEGKTLVATMPAYLRSLTGKGVHVVTVNDYLAKYQSDLMARVFNFLGVSVGCVLVGQEPAERRRQYEADITYGTNNEFGFDYLRDNMAQRVEDMVQRGHNYVIVDEVDSILIDEARTPLIISGPASGDVNRWYTEFARIARLLEAGVDYEVDEKKRTVGVLEDGIDKVEDQLGVENLYEAANTPLIGFLNNAIKAKELFHRDRDYIVDGGEVLIVDEHTGRVLPGRRYNDGMHQAIEAKEGVQIKAENQTLATITLQNYFRLYPEGSRAGMTGTAETEAAEFASTYKIGVIPIPTNRPMIRKDQTDLVYPTEKGKLAAIIEDIVARHDAGQPVLVGTASVEKSELVSRLLKERHIPHQVLNAKQHAREAQVVAMAGRKGAVTVATNMAGRGTDIMLGGNSEFIAQANLAARGLDPKENPEEYREQWPIALEEAEAAVQAEREEVRELGGLYVLGTERHESRRIDNQLRGRSGRQGDPGESRFYLSMEDDLMRLFNQGLAQRIMSSGAYPEDLPLENKVVTRSIASAQRQVEARNFEIRKNVLKYDDVMTGQRELIYDERRRVLEGEDLKVQLSSFAESLVTGIVDQHTAGLPPRDWDLDVLWDTLRAYYPPSVTYAEVEKEYGGRASMVRSDLVGEVVGDIRTQYMEAEERLNANPLALQQLGEEPMRELERRVVIATVDRLWREHLYEMDYLKEGIGLRAMGQRDPLVEYKDEGAKLFSAMMERIREESVQQVFGFVKQFDVALTNAQEQADRVRAAEPVATGKPSTGVSASAEAGAATASAAPGQAAPSASATVDESTVAAVRAAAVAKAASVMGTVGHESQSRRLRYSSSDRERTSASAPSPTSGEGPFAGGNRAQRRAARRRRKH